MARFISRRTSTATTRGWTGRWRRGTKLREPTAACSGSPHPHASRVHVNEVRRGVVADTAATRVERRPSQPGQGYIRETDIDRLPFHVQAASGDAFTAVPQHLVGRGRSKRGNHLKGPGRFCHFRQAMEQV